MIPLLASLESLSLGAISSCLTVFVPLKWTWMPSLLQVLLNFSPKPCMYGMPMEMFLFVGPLLLSLLLLLLLCSSALLLLLWLCFCRNCCCNFFRAQLGNWHSLSALLRCSNILFRSSGVLDTTLALWPKVFYTLFLAVMKWLLSQCRVGLCVLVSCKLLWEWWSCVLV